MIMSSAQSRKSSLLHILAGDIAVDAELVKPLLFMRESSATGHNSKLSVNLSQMYEEDLDRCPI